jgi:septum formation protein
MTHGSIQRLILASASPRRAQLLADNGYQFDIVRPPLHEPEEGNPRIPPEQYAEALSYYKARSVANATDCPDAAILAADTVVAYQDHLFGKPRDAADARYILSTLAGTTHEVITGVTVLQPASGKRLIAHETTRVTMRPMSLEVLDRYIASGEWEGKAGAYGIQDHGDAYIERIEGSFTNVVGLPMSLVARMLEEVGYVRTGANHAAPSSTM